jgi:aspartate 1-decarboxylase
VDYEGSCEIDGILLEAAGIHAFEQQTVFLIIIGVNAFLALYKRIVKRQH